MLLIFVFRRRDMKLQLRITRLGRTPQITRTPSWTVWGIRYISTPRTPALPQYYCILPVHLLYNTTCINSLYIDKFPKLYYNGRFLNTLSEKYFRYRISPFICSFLYRVFFVFVIMIS